MLHHLPTGHFPYILPGQQLGLVNEGAGGWHLCPVGPLQWRVKCRVLVGF